MILACREVCELVTDAGEGALTGFQRAAYRVHLVICPGCRAYVKGFSQVREAMKELPEEQAPPEVREEALRRLRERKQRT